MKAKFISCLFLVLVLPASLAQDIESSPVISVDFDADYYDYGSAGNYGVIVLTGSGGGKADYTATQIAAMGYDVLSLAYFDRSGSEVVPDTLELIPLEYFEAPKKWLMNRPNTRSDGVVLYGLSKGAELALVLASFDKEYKAVIALAPSNVVWQGNPKNFADLMSSPSSWSRQGQGLPFVPYISTEERDRLGFSNRHEASLTNRKAVEEALIEVENITGPVLLISGGADSNWPSSSMAEQICEDVNSAGAATCNHIEYEEGDHLLSEHQLESFAEVSQFLDLVAP